MILMRYVLAILGFYFFHWFLVYKTDLGKKIKWLNKPHFRYFWNVALFLSFLPTATTGILLYLGYTNRSLIDLHNQGGVVMVVVGVLHLITRISYFLNLPKQ